MFSASLSFCRLLTLFSVLLSPFLSFSFSLSRIFTLYFQFVSLGFFHRSLFFHPLSIYFSYFFSTLFFSFIQFPFFHLSSLLFHPSFSFFSLLSPSPLSRLLPLSLFHLSHITPVFLFLLFLLFLPSFTLLFIF